MLCEVCKNDIGSHPRYTKLVCYNCSLQAIDSDGNRVIFYNDDITGGIVSTHYDSKGTWNNNDNLCSINGIKCRAYEHRFGGIAIVPL